MTLTIYFKATNRFRTKGRFIMKRRENRLNEPLATYPKEKVPIPDPPLADEYKSYYYENE